MPTRTCRGRGVGQESVRFVGNVMIDTLVRLLPAALARWQSESLQRLDIRPSERYVLVTLHRPSNVDDPEILEGVLAAMAELARDLPVIFPVHPRTRSRMEEFGLQDLTSLAGGLRLTEPFGYLDFLALERCAALVLTDSGGVQEETTYLGVPCLTLRSNTERPVTITQGTNRLAPSRQDALVEIARETLSLDMGRETGYRPPELWDGRAAERITDAMRQSPSRRAVRPSGVGAL